MRRRTLLALGTAVLVLVAPTPLALAGKGQGGSPLPAGPNSISGPLAVELEPARSSNVWTSQFPVGVCMTVAVTGRARVLFFLMKQPNTQIRNLRVESGDSGVLCHPGADLAGISCSSQSPTDCAAVWRVDAY